MSVRMRHTRAHTRNRRSHHALDRVNVVVCKKCGAAALPHRACLNCGTYKGNQVIDVLKKIVKKEKKMKARQSEAKEQEKTAKKGLDAAELSKK